MSNFRGYYIRIGDCSFLNPAIKREGYRCTPRIVQVTDEERLASGKLIIKPLEHQPSKLYVTFPIMKPEQFQYYCRAFRGKLTGEQEMYLTIEYYNDEDDAYYTGTFYHTDIDYQPVIYNGQRMILMSEIRFIEH